jgi:hypothetical protein
LRWSVRSLRTENQELRTLLREDVFHPSQQRPALGLILHRRKFSQLVQQFALALG